MFYPIIFLCLIETTVDNIFNRNYFFLHFVRKVQKFLFKKVKRTKLNKKIIKKINFNLIYRLRYNIYFKCYDF